MIVRKLCDLRLGLFASAQYLERVSSPISTNDLHGLDALVFRAGAGQLRPWTLNKGGRICEIAPKAVLVTSDGRAMIGAAIAGLGIAEIFDRLAHPHVVSRELVRVLPEAGVPGPPVHALIPLGRRMPPKTRVVLDHLVELLRTPLPGGQ